MATQHVCVKHPDTPGEWVDGTLGGCPYHIRAGVPNYSPGSLRLRKELESGQSMREVEKEIVDSAKAEGRDLARPSDFPHL